MINLRLSNERGHFNHGWLDTFHTFSFADYFDPRFSGFRTLRVINEDRVQPGEGFGMHSHHNMEILTYVIQGALAHKDSMGNGSVIHPGDIQIMSAGTGIRHSEFNESEKESVHLLQIWMLPDRQGITPRYEQVRFEEKEKTNRLKLIGSKTGRDGSVVIHQQIDLYASILDAGKSVSYEVRKEAGVWLQVIAGQILVHQKSLSAGDGLYAENESKLVIQAQARSEFLLFDIL